VGEEMISVGIDPALNHTGVAILRNGEVLRGEHRPRTWRTTYRGAERLYWLKGRLRDLMDEVNGLRRKNELAWYGLEDYAYSLGKSAHQMGEWGGQLRVTFYEHGIRQNAVEKRERLWIINQSEVKKFATDSGTSKKEKLLMEVGKKWHQSFDSSDEAEAFVMALMLYWVAALKHGRRSADEITKYQLEVLTKHLSRA
jgi:Holliday junction resolvasome RuvABC endonuclease subunit